MEDCIFCEIVAGKLPCAKVYEDENCLAFLDINPLNEGHTLIIPKEHHERLTDMTGEEVAAVLRKAPEIARAVVAVTGAPGFNLFQTNGAVSGQVVPHVHFHIVPRHAGDGLGFRWNPGKYKEGEMDKLCEAIRTEVQQSSAR